MEAQQFQDLQKLYLQIYQNIDESDYSERISQIRSKKSQMRDKYGNPIAIGHGVVKTPQQHSRQSNLDTHSLETKAVTNKQVKRHFDRVDRNRASLKKEEIDTEIIEDKKPFPTEKVERQIGKHLSKASASWSSRGGKSDPRKTSSYQARYRKMNAIKSSVERGEDPRSDSVQGDRRKIFTKEYGQNVSAKTVDDEKSAYTPGGLRAHKTKAGGYRTLVRKEELEAIIEFLFSEGYANTFENAEVIANNISEEWMDEILSEKFVKSMNPQKGRKSLKDRQSYKGTETEPFRGDTPRPLRHEIARSSGRSKKPKNYD